MDYEMCEECGCVFVARSDSPVLGVDEAQRELISFFRAFAARSAAPRD